MEQRMHKPAMPYTSEMPPPSGELPVARRLSPVARNRQRGFTLLELIVTMAVLAIMVGAAVPVAKNNIKRQREEELRRNLREIRMALEAFRMESSKFSPFESDRWDRNTGYPKKLEYLVEGMKTQGLGDRTLKFLRHIPRDPMTNSTEWGTRSTQDDPGSDSSGDENVFDVYSKSTETALNGTKYKDW